MYRSLLTALLLCLPLTALAQPTLGVDPVGTWLGRLSVPGAELRMIFHIARGPDDRLTSTMDSPDQGAIGLPVTSTTLDGTTLRLTMPAIGGQFEGRLSGDRLEGAWSQGGASFPLSLERTDERSDALRPPARPQEPLPPFPYDTQEVSFDSPGARLAGTLTIPVGDGPFPAVVLLSGSGPQDRNEEIFGHKPFLVLADALTRRGVAVLRFDDRGVGASTGEFGTATMADFKADARAALALLRARPEVDASRTGAIGHSEGASVAAAVGAEEDGPAFVVLLAGPGVPGEALLYEQSALLMRAGGATEQQIEQNDALQRRTFAIVKRLPGPEAADSVRAMLAGLGMPAAQTDAQVSQVTSDWFRELLSYDPAPALAQIEVPVLALFGEKDLQVPPSLNEPPVRSALDGRNPATRIEILPDLNHLFQPAGTGGIDEYAQISTTFDETALTLIGDWIKRVTH